MQDLSEKPVSEFVLRNDTKHISFNVFKEFATDIHGNQTKEKLYFLVKGKKYDYFTPKTTTRKSELAGKGKKSLVHELKLESLKPSFEEITNKIISIANGTITFTGRYGTELTSNQTHTAREIANATGIDPKTINRYYKPAFETGLIYETTGAKKKARTRTVKSFKEEKILDQWIEDNEVIQKWQNKIRNKFETSQRNFLTNVHFVTNNILKVSPDEFLGKAADFDGTQDEIEQQQLDFIENEMEEVRLYTRRKGKYEFEEVKDTDPDSDTFKQTILKKRKKLKNDGAARFYSFRMAVRSFIQANGVNLPRGLPQSHALSGAIVGHGNYAGLRIRPQKLEYGLQQLKKEIVQPYKFRGKKIDAHPADTAYLLAMLSIWACGFRSIEALTITMSNVSKVPKAIGADNNEYLEKGKHNYTVWFQTRKGAWSGKLDRRGKESLVTEPTLIELLDKRFDEKTTMLFGEPDQFVAFDETMIGRDYDPSVKVKQYGIPVKHEILQPLVSMFQKIADNGGIRTEIDQRTGKLKEDSYFVKKPIHALRHVFAQFWLSRSQWNYGFVAQLGHWNTVGELQDSYGKQNEAIFNSHFKEFANKVYNTKYREGIDPPEMEWMDRKDHKIQISDETILQVSADLPASESAEDALISDADTDDEDDGETVKDE